MDQDIREIESITFGVYSNDEIRNISVAQINNTKLTNVPGSVYDERLGVIENGKLCETCKQDAKKCPGHFGHIELNESIINPLFYKEVRDMLSYFCVKCFRLLLTKEQILLSGSKSKEKIKNRLRNECGHCNHSQPEFKYSPTENTISMVYKQKANNKLSIILSVNEIKNTFDNILKEDLELIGVNVNLVHPRNFIMDTFLVMPPCTRPPVIADGNVCDDDLTNQYIEINKSNNHLVKDVTTENNHQKYLQSLKFRISTFFNNSGGKAKHTTSGRAIKGLSERLKGKGGQLRSNLMGKRCLDPNTPVLLWNGKIKKAYKIKVGDILIGDDGHERIVKNICKGEDEMFMVSQMRGNDYIVNSKHMLTLKFCGHKSIYWNVDLNMWGVRWFNKTKLIIEDAYYNNIKDAEIFNETIKEDDIIDISIEDYINLPNKYKIFLMGFKLPISVNWKYKSYKEDPYEVGFSITDLDSIPKVYIVNDINTRLLFLAGVFDSIGIIEGESIKLVSININDNVLQEIIYICNSLGLRTKYVTNGIVVTGSNLEDVPSVVYLNKLHNIDLAYMLYKISIKPIGMGNFVGFEVTGNGRFLLGDFTVTHNCDQTGRTVIGPDPTLKMGQLAVPIEIANNLTIPVRVTKFNISDISDLVNKGGANYVLKNEGKTRINLNYALNKKGTELVYGDEIYRNGNIIKVRNGNEKLLYGDRIKRNGVFLEEVKYAEKRKYNLEIGDIVERKLQDGDIVLLNRQPTLWKGSMMAQEIVIKPYKTLRFNLSINKSFNADFDGDEIDM